MRKSKINAASPSARSYEPTTASLPMLRKMPESSNPATMPSSRTTATWASTVGSAQQDIHARKGLKKGAQILDHMGSTELAANLFRATQAEEKLRREKITGKANANKAHREVGAKVRQTIKELGGTMPEELPTVESIKKLESKARKTLKKPKP